MRISYGVCFVSFMKNKIYFLAFQLSPHMQYHIMIDLNYIEARFINIACIWLSMDH